MRKTKLLMPGLRDINLLIHRAKALPLGQMNLEEREEKARQLLAEMDKCLQASKPLREAMDELENKREHVADLLQRLSRYKLNLEARIF